MRSEYANCGQLMNRIRQLETELNEQQLAAQVSEIRPGFPVILCTGFSTEMVKEEDSPNAIQAYLNKPIFIQEIAETIRRVLDAENAS